MDGRAAARRLAWRRVGPIHYILPAGVGMRGERARAMDLPKD